MDALRKKLQYVPIVLALIAVKTAMTCIVENLSVRRNATQPGVTNMAITNIMPTACSEVTIVSASNESIV